MNKIIAFGDSLVNGYGLEEKETWRFHLEKACACPVFNFGVNGETSKEALLRLDQVLEMVDEQTVVIMNHGTNDVFTQQDRYGRVDFESYAHNIRKMAQAFKSKKAQVIFLSVPWIYVSEKSNEYFFARHPKEQYQKQDPQKLLEKFTKKQKELAQDLDLVFVDLFHHQALRDWQLVLRNYKNSNEDDGVHYSSDGAKIVGEIILRVIEEGAIL